LREPATLLASRAERLAPALLLSDAVASRWAIRRLLGRALATPALDARVAALPFDMHPARVALPSPAGAEPLPSMGALVSEQLLTAAALRSSIPFEQSTLLTADGHRVRERRHTAWLAEDGIGALAYSGKLMKPARLDENTAILKLRNALHADTGERFDCALCNFYASGGQAACAWHRDPEHGDGGLLDAAKWARPTYVVSVGETRRFAFRRHAQASEERFSVSLFAGDVIAMYGRCNDDFEHSVLPGQGAANDGARVSIVFKRALVSRDGRRGHTLEGQGRRARARLRDAAAGVTDTAPSPTSPAGRGRSASQRDGLGRGTINRRGRGVGRGRPAGDGRAHRHRRGRGRG
jgi:alkylated DNA repair dioxygenase AlkB